MKLLTLASSLLPFVSMTNKKMNIVARLCLIGIVFMCSVTAAWAASFEKTNLFSVEFINLIRTDPLAHAEKLGYNRIVLLETLPWIGKWADAIAPITSSAFLNQKAALLNDDVIAAVELTPTMGTDFAYTGDIGGVVSLENDILHEDAIKVIINNQFVKELDPDYEGKRFILSKVYSLVGTSLWESKTSFQSQPGGACFIAVCFASSLLRSEVQIVNMINQTRAQAVTSNQTLVLITAFLPRPLSPLFLNNSLQLVSRMGLTSRIDFPLYAQKIGFPGAQVVESSVIEKFPKADFDLYTLWLFYSLAFTEAQLYSVKNGIFSSSNNAIGSAVYSVTGQTHDSVKLTMATGFAQRSESDIFRIYGIVFKDFDRNKAYTPGEGLADRVVTVSLKDTQVKVGRVITNNAGQFSICLPGQTEYSIHADTGANRAGVNCYLDSDRYFDFIVH